PLPTPRRRWRAPSRDRRFSPFCPSRWTSASRPPCSMRPWPKRGTEKPHAAASGLAHSHGSAHSSVTQAHGLDQAMAVSVEPFRPHSRSDSLSDGDWKARLPLIAGAVIAVLALAAGGYFLFGRSSNQAVPHP